jgi:hypothetical protein
MEESTKRELEELIGQIKCPKDFVCYRSGLKELCKAEDIGMKSYLKCLEEGRKPKRLRVFYGIRGISLLHLSSSPPYCEKRGQMNQASS